MSWSNVPIKDAPGLIGFLVGQVKRKKDAMICSHGGEGTGKSTTAENIGRAAGKRLGVKPIKIYTMRQLFAVLISFKRGQIYILDEAINIFHNQDWSTWQAKLLTKIIRQMRIMQCIWILCVPDFEGLHPYLRQSRIPIRLYHAPVWDSDGLANGPAKLLFKQERFDYSTGQVEIRWQDTGDIHSHCLDNDPDWEQYEQDKINNFKELVQEMIDRQDTEDAKAEGTKRKTKPKKSAKAKDHPSPPITT